MTIEIFEMTRDELITLKRTSPDSYNFIMSVKRKEGDYCKTLDKEKLKSECEKGYFNIDDLFTKDQIKSAHLNIVSAEREQENKKNLEDVEKEFGVASFFAKNTKLFSYIKKGGTVKLKADSHNIEMIAQCIVRFLGLDAKEKNELRMRFSRSEFDGYIVKKHRVLGFLYEETYDDFQYPEYSLEKKDFVESGVYPPEEETGEFVGEES